LDELDVAMVVFDEFQHIFDGRSNGAIKTAAQFVKNLEKNLKGPIVLAGMRGIEDFIRRSPELRRRFSTRLRISRYRLRSGDAQEFRGFAKAIEDALPLPLQESPLVVGWNEPYRVVDACVGNGGDEVSDRSDGTPQVSVAR